MSQSMVEMQGTLTPDGTLVLDEKPSLPAGRVRVTVQPVLDYTQTSIWKFFEQLRAEQQATGFTPRSKEDIDAAVTAMRDDERSQEIERIQEECRLHREQPPSTEAG